MASTNDGDGGNIDEREKEIEFRAVNTMDGSSSELDLNSDNALEIGGRDGEEDTGLESTRSELETTRIGLTSAEDDQMTLSNDHIYEANGAALLEQARLELENNKRLDKASVRMVYLTYYFGDLKETNSPSSLLNGRVFINDFYNKYEICWRVHILRLPEPNERIWMSLKDPDGMFHAIPTVLFKLGLRFPLYSFLTDIFEYIGYGFSQVVPNSHLILYAFIARCHEIDVEPNIDMFFSIYRMNMLKSSNMYFFCTRAHRVSLVTAPTSHPSWKSDFIFGRGPELSVLSHWKILPSKTLLSFNGRGLYSEEDIRFVNGEECFRHEDFHDSSFLRSHGLSGSKKQVIVGGGKAGSSVPSALALAVLDRKKKAAANQSPTKSTHSSQVVPRPSSSAPTTDDHLARVGGKEKVQGRSLKRPLKKSSSGALIVKKTKVIPDAGPSLGCTITVGDREGWFVGQNRPYQLFDGFNLLNDADHYVARTAEDLEEETDLFLCRFVSNYTHMRRGFGHGLRSRLNDLQAKYDVLEQEKADLVKAMESLQLKEKSLNEQVQAAADERKKFNDTMSKLKGKCEERMKILKDKVGSQNEKISDLKKLADDRANELSSLTTKVSESKDLAAQSMEIGYKACLQKFIDDEVDVNGKSWEDYEKELQAAFGCDDDGREEQEQEKNDGRGGDGRDGDEDGRDGEEVGHTDDHEENVDGDGEGDKDADANADTGSKSNEKTTST